MHYLCIKFQQIFWAGAVPSVQTTPFTSTLFPLQGLSYVLQ